MSGGKGQGLHDFTHLWNIKQKATNKQAHRHKQYGGLPKGKEGWGEEEEDKRVDSMVKEGDYTWDDEHTMQYRGDILTDLKTWNL